MRKKWIIQSSTLSNTHKHFSTETRPFQFELLHYDLRSKFVDFLLDLTRFYHCINKPYMMSYIVLVIFSSKICFSHVISQCKQPILISYFVTTFVTLGKCTIQQDLSIPKYRNNGKQLQKRFLSILLTCLFILLFLFCYCCFLLLLLFSCPLPSLPFIATLK